MATVCIIDHVTDRVFLSVHGIQNNVAGDKILRTKRPKVKTRLVSMVDPFLLFIFRVCHAVLSVRCSIVVTSWERADPLALLYVMS